MKKTKIIFWTITGLFSAFMLFSSVPDILVVPDAKSFMNHLGYPDYIIPFLGVMKLLGIIAILLPGFPRIKEWAYAGLVFDLISAFYSIIASGQSAANWVFMFLPLSIAAASYIFYQKKKNSPS